MRTPEELERLAYITGDTKTADLLAQVIDAKDYAETLEDDLDNRPGEIDDLHTEIDILNAEIDELKETIAELESEKS